MKKENKSWHKRTKSDAEYRDGAIEELERQLANAQTEKRKQKLRVRIAEWKNK